MLFRSRFDGTLALNAWTAREGLIAVGDEIRVLDGAIDVVLPAPGRFG